MLINDLLADRETVPDATPEAGADTAAPENAAPSEGAVEETEDSAVETVEAPAASFDPAQLAEFQTRLEAAEARNGQLEQVLGQLLSGADQTGQETGPLPVDVGQLDPFADDFGQQLATLLVSTQQQTVAQIAQLVQQVTQPLEQQREQETIARGDSNLEDMLADDVARNGEFHPKPEVDQRARAMTRDRANQVYLELANRHGGHDQVLAYGLGPKVAEQAMAQAAREVRELFNMIGSTAVQVEDNRRAGLAVLPAEPGVAGDGVQGPGRFESASAVGDYYASKAQSLTSAA